MIEEKKRLYLEERMSTVAIGKRYGLSSTTVWRQLTAAGVEMRPPGPIPHDTRGSYQSVHRRRWQSHYGLIPDECVIHHVNGDHTDNGLENLACVTQAEHGALHKRLSEGHGPPSVTLGFIDGDTMPWRDFSGVSPRTMAVNRDSLGRLICIGGISDSEMARATGFSVAYVAQVVAGNMPVDISFLDRAAVYIAARVGEPVVIMRVLVGSEQ